MYQLRKNIIVLSILTLDRTVNLNIEYDIQHVSVSQRDFFEYCGMVIWDVSFVLKS